MGAREVKTVESDPPQERKIHIQIEQNNSPGGQRAVMTGCVNADYRRNRAKGNNCLGKDTGDARPRGFFCSE